MKGTIFFCIFGVLALVFGTFRLFHHFWLKKTCTIQVRGDVSFLPYKPDSEKKKLALNLLRFISKVAGQRSDVAQLGTITIYHEVIIYSVDGVERVVPTGHNSIGDDFRYSTGQNVVTVAYDPSNPERYIVLEQEGSISLGVTCIVLGAIFAMIPLISQLSE